MSAPERIWASGFNSQPSGRWWHETELTHGVLYIRADLAPASPKVKALVWRDSYKVFRAETPFGDYMVTGKIMRLPTSGHAEMVCENPDAAKAAAQADYEARILAALEGGDG